MTPANDSELDELGIIAHFDSHNYDYESIDYAVPFLENVSTREGMRHAFAGIKSCLAIRRPR